MKLLAFTDLHLSNIALKKIKLLVKKSHPDVLVCAGDITIFEEGLDLMLKKLDSMGKKIILVNGNHEDDSTMERFCRKYKNLVFIHKKSHEENGCIFLGYGGSGFSTTEPDFYGPAKKFRDIIKKGKNKKIILLTHAPPYGTKVDLIVDQHCGNKTFSDFIRKNRIDLHICGHLHENFRKEDNIKKTRIINPGPYGKIIVI